MPQIMDYDQGFYLIEEKRFAKQSGSTRPVWAAEMHWRLASIFVCGDAYVFLLVVSNTDYI